MTSATSLLGSSAAPRVLAFTRQGSPLTLLLQPVTDLVIVHSVGELGYWALRAAFDHVVCEVWEKDDLLIVAKLLSGLDPSKVLFVCRDTQRDCDEWPQPLQSQFIAGPAIGQRLLAAVLSGGEVKTPPPAWSPARR